MVDFIYFLIFILFIYVHVHMWVPMEAKEVNSSPGLDL